MDDPYSILGVSPTASNEDVKKAYRALARKYHPDNYVGNPLADLAQEKMQQINQAYSQIQTMRKWQSASSASSSAGTSSTKNPFASYYENNPSQFPDIRRLVQTHRILEAEELLEGVPSDKRDAEWFFLRGNTYFYRGWLEDAYYHFQQAVSMAPDNPEYRAALSQCNFQRTSGMPAGYGYSNMTRNDCDNVCLPCMSAWCLSQFCRFRC